MRAPLVALAVLVMCGCTSHTESGFDAGARGIGTFYIWAIPAILGVAALVWLAFFMQSRGWFLELSQERRRAIYVGASERPKSKLKIELPPSSVGLTVERVDIEGKRASVYVKNSGNNTLEGMTVHYQLVSPSGFLLNSDTRWMVSLDGPERLSPGETGECVFEGYHTIKTDPRAESIRFWVEGYPAR